MSIVKKSVLAVLAAIGLVFSSLTTPAFADGPSFNIELSGGSLSQSTLSGFGADQNISLTLTVTSGTMYFNAGASTASLISLTNPGSTLFLQGTQDQIATAFSAISFNTGCDGSIELSATLEAGGGILNSYNGHYYRLVQEGVSFADAKTMAASLTFDGTPTGTPGYLATITSSGENDFLYTVMGGSGQNAWIGGSDEETEGDWKWITGPEAGTSFYFGNVNEAQHGPVNGEFSGWNPGEPNQFFGDDPIMQEDYAEVYGSGYWNDIPSEPGRNNYFVVEWGGMPGDNFTGAVSLTDTATQAPQIPFAGDGTQQSPYLISTAAELSKVGGCGDYGVYFQQTADIDVSGTNFTPIGTTNKNFNGNYDGGDHTISGFVASNYYDGVFGIVNNGTISNLHVDAAFNATGVAYLGAVASAIYNSTVTNVSATVSGSAAGSAYIGAIAGQAQSTTFTNVTSTGSMNLTGWSSRAGGLFGWIWGTTLTGDSHSDVAFTTNPAEFIGGLAGGIDNSNIDGFKFTGSIDAQSTNYIGGIAGYMSGGNISQTLSTAEINGVGGGNYIGGFVGQVYYGNFQQVASSGAISVDAYNVGGLLGYSYQSQITDSFSGGDVSGGNDVGQLIGYAENNSLNRVHAIGALTTSGHTNGLFGYNGGFNDFSASFWVPEATGLVDPVDVIEDEVANSVEDSQSDLTYSNAGWSIGSGSVDLANTWTICASSFSGTPFVSALFPDGCLPLQTLIPTPSISGSGAANDVLTAEPGSWDDGASLSYRWYVDGKKVSGATGATYTPSVNQIGQTITVKVVSTKAGAATATSPASAGVQVSLATLGLTPTPQLSGDASYGGLVSVDAGTWDDGVSLSYQWYLNGTPVANGTDYEPGLGDIGGELYVEVTATKSGYATVVMTSQAVEIGAATQTLTPTPVIGGTPTFGGTMTADAGTWDDGVSVAYQWFADGVLIADAVTSSYTPSADQVGVKFTVQVTATKDGFGTVVKTSDEVTVAAASLVLTPTPTVTGTGKVGSTLTVDPGTWDEGVTITIQWFVNGSEVSGANGTTLDLSKVMAGKTITVKVTGTKAGFAPVAQDSVDPKTVRAVVVPKTTIESSFGGMAGNSWWMTWGMKNGVRKAVKAHPTYTTLVCTGIVKAGGSKTWLKTLGLKRAQAGCWIAKLQNPKLKVSYKYVVAKPNARVQRGFTLTFSK